MGPRNSWAEAATEGIALTHKIKGSSGSIGFMKISEAAALLEQKFKVLLDANQQLTDDHKAQIFRQFEELSELITNIKPEVSTLYDANFSL